MLQGFCFGTESEHSRATVNSLCLRQMFPVCRLQQVYMRDGRKGRVTYHDLDGLLKAADRIFKSLGLHVSFAQENKQRSYRFHASCSFKNFNGLQVKQRLVRKVHDTCKEPNLLIWGEMRVR